MFWYLADRIARPSAERERAGQADVWCDVPDPNSERKTHVKSYLTGDQLVSRLLGSVIVLGLTSIATAQVDVLELE